MAALDLVRGHITAQTREAAMLGGCFLCLYVFNVYVLLKKVGFFTECFLVPHPPSYDFLINLFVAQVADQGLELTLRFVVVQLAEGHRARTRGFVEIVAAHENLEGHVWFLDISGFDIIRSISKHPYANRVAAETPRVPYPNP
jgi:hypothetical protein